MLSSSLKRTLLALVLGAIATPAAALEEGREPYISIRTGLKCSTCHANRTGGGGRTDFGYGYATTSLPMATGETVSRRIADFLSVGGDFRLLGTAAVTDATPRTVLDVEEANVYLEARFLDDQLSFYLDQTVGPNRSGSREVFALLGGLPLAGYAKAGKFLPPYGLRLQDDQEFIRERTGFTFNTPDQGVEVGIEPGPLSLFVALTNGAPGAAENNSDKQLTASAVYVRRHFRFGGSASRNGNSSDGRDVFGGFGGFTFWRFTVLGEVDYISDKSTAGDVDRIAAFGEVDFLATQGVNAKFSYGYLDPDNDTPEDERVRVRFGLEVFPRAYLRLAGFYTIDDWIPQADNDPDRGSLEVHVYF